MAEKLFTVAMGRCAAVVGALLGASVCCTLVGELPVLTLMRRALFFAEERAGRSIAARAAMTATTMRSSMSVKPRRKGSFIIHL